MTQLYASNDSVLVALLNSPPQQIPVRFCVSTLPPAIGNTHTFRRARRRYLPVIVAFLVALSMRPHLQIVLPWLWAACSILFFDVFMGALFVLTAHTDRDICSLTNLARTVSVSAPGPAGTPEKPHP
ncbi:hypothetical protein C8R45DRAFT_1222662 [Mycena sanguinolenta]|nr:hypothetical protein C8R45DRAFT_1222662 [Mycena sanguinolenta]